MIYVHTYYTGKFSSVKHVRVYDCIDEAFYQQCVLGGAVKVYELIGEVL